MIVISTIIVKSHFKTGRKTNPTSLESTWLTLLYFMCLVISFKF